MANKHYTREVAERLRSEMLENARTAAAALKLPDDAADGHTMPRAQFIAMVRENSFTVPEYGNQVLDRLGPACIPGPDGTMLRAETGLDNFIELVKEARPDVYAAVMLSEPS